ncbi:DUF4192 domain-containing protein [Bifidobacterium oedipodis]|uniref:DUF4192 family protein n=1 Tax=Bifidobacterium oedipodis TaxID=2675322 RepID=A0A7Y0HS14_9BIFI|nr:DUF4192 domain-containing protein [Bifidobacterium sp. DSM 109957]NMM93093.1 hypothetical protein [Bifidobacterium sp. DSM 109957]
MGQQHNTRKTRAGEQRKKTCAAAGPENRERKSNPENARARHERKVADSMPTGRAQPSGRERPRRCNQKDSRDEHQKNYQESYFEREHLEMLARAFRQDRRERGAPLADADWVDGPLDSWLACLDTGESHLEGEDMAAFAVGMAETLSIRDALILSLIIDERRCPKSQLIEFAARPHLVHAKQRMGELLTAAFWDEGLAPDRERCMTGIDILIDLAEAVPVPYCVQPLAIIAYALWWMGDARSEAFAAQCLVLDGECSLAAMIFSACEHQLAPAWCIEQSE